MRRLGSSLFVVQCVESNVKTAIYIEDGNTQIVLTPDNDWEKTVLAAFTGSAEIKISRGEFYECGGGWVRQGSDKESVILKLK